VSKRPSAGSDYARGMAQASWGLALAFGFVAIMMACFFLGRLIDGWLGSEPIVEIAGALVGFALGSVTVYFGAQRRAS
jgi:F0F1-type ATP synthase assembly protein I